MSNPNFPQNLDIKPLLPSNGDLDGNFDFSHQQEAIRVFGIAGKVWKAAYALNTYIQPPADHEFDPPFFASPRSPGTVTMIELGSGTGIVAATVSPMLREGDVLFVTDLLEVCPLLEQNLQRFLDGAVRVRPLSWGNSIHVSQIAEEISKLPRARLRILCSDLVYFPELLAPLLRSLIQLSSPPFAIASNDVEIIISYKVRSLPKETPFWSAFGLWFEFAPVLVRRTSQDIHSWRRFGASLEDPTFIFVAHRREESLGWQVPLRDEDLMQGRIAPDQVSPKGDDTFETLLLLSLDDNDEL
ncbi:tumor-related protein [Favolaschia claudopus]|uniref:Tumor-related protein n=1 Tax=Favolaschia claudopus TaxID=2862362 RepID=A0AAW0C426_9AGAR